MFYRKSINKSLILLEKSLVLKFYHVIRKKRREAVIEITG